MGTLKKTKALLLRSSGSQCNQTSDTAHTHADVVIHPYVRTHRAKAGAEMAGTGADGKDECTSTWGYIAVDSLA